MIQAKPLMLENKYSSDSEDVSDDEELKQELEVLRQSKGSLVLKLGKGDITEQKEAEKQQQSSSSCSNPSQPKKNSGTGWSFFKTASIAVGAGVASVAAVPVVLGCIGFTGAGIAAGSFAASAMSAAAGASGGGVAAGSTIAVLQSVGAAGLGIGAKIGIGVGGATVAKLLL